MSRAVALVVVSALLVACGAPDLPKMTSSTPGVGEPSSVAPDERFGSTPVSPAPPPAETKPASAPSAPPPAPTLGETPEAKLGTAPAGLGLAVGQKAPDATLEDLSGKKQKLSDLYKAGPTFVVFYRGGWCPFCNVQLHDLAAAKADFDKRGFRLVAISVDRPNEEAKTQAKDGVPFAMLSDSELVALKAFKLVHVASEEEQQKLARRGIDLGAYSGEGHKSFAVPAIFVVDRSGTIRFAHVDEDYKTRPSVRQLLGVADKLGAK